MPLDAKMFVNVFGTCWKHFFIATSEIGSPKMFATPKFLSDGQTEKHYKKLSNVFPRIVIKMTDSFYK